MTCMFADASVSQGRTVIIGDLDDLAPDGAHFLILGAGITKAGGDPEGSVPCLQGSIETSEGGEQPHVHRSLECLGEFLVMGGA